MLDAWKQFLRNVRRNAKSFKPAAVLAALKLIDDGQATASHVPLEPLLATFDAVMRFAGLDQHEEKGHEPVFRLSTDVSACSFLPHPVSDPVSNKALLAAAEAVCFEPGCTRR